MSLTEDIVRTRVETMLIISIVSLFGERLFLWNSNYYLQLIGWHFATNHIWLSPAASFPSISKRTKALRIPRIVFFIGKHFGTGLYHALDSSSGLYWRGVELTRAGVILSTAFVHLLQDAFSSLQDPAVSARWKIGHWTGLIVWALPPFNDSTHSSIPGRSLMYYISD